MPNPARGRTLLGLKPSKRPGFLIEIGTTTMTLAGTPSASRKIRIARLFCRAAYRQKNMFKRKWLLHRAKSLAHSAHAEILDLMPELRHYHVDIQNNGTIVVYD